MMRSGGSVWLALALFAALATAVPVAAQTPTSPPPPPPPAPPVESVPVATPAPDPEALGQDENPFRVFAGVQYGTLAGSEIENADPLEGFEAGASYRVIWVMSVDASYAVSSSNIEGQVVQLLDVPVRSDGRSGNVSGQISQTRLRVGVRVDGLRQPDFSVQPYMVAALTFNTNKVELDTVDGGPPAHPSYEDDQFGALGRLGADFNLTSMISIDANMYYEVFEFQPATNASIGVGAGISLRF